MLAILAIALGYLYPPLRQLEDELPDAIAHQARATDENLRED
ncbi:hypothetical protein [Fischerella thermalis]|nr:hypothetical protein [Fischerella thermalis]